ncbi:MAG: nucleoside-triphosphatase, partial [Draconibacterium sp.]|nr:nucleoside-triphosphatase [Draconibacterium sp.]
FAGFYSERILNDGKTHGYNIVEVENGQKTNLLSILGNDTQLKIGKYYISNKGFETGKKVLEKNSTRLTVIDEVGKLELSGKGWSEPLTELINQNKNHLILTFRKEILNELIEKFNIEDCTVFDVDEASSEEIRKKIVKEFTTID